jgi:hypothetical protein
LKAREEAALSRAKGGLGRGAGPRRDKTLSPLWGDVMTTMSLLKLISIPHKIRGLFSLCGALSGVCNHAVSHVNQDFQPEQLAKMTEAFDLA